jgi:hypothetical protein
MYFGHAKILKVILTVFFMCQVKFHAKKRTTVSHYVRYNLSVTLQMIYRRMLITFKIADRFEREFQYDGNIRYHKTVYRKLFKSVSSTARHHMFHVPYCAT